MNMIKQARTFWIEAFAADEAKELTVRVGPWRCAPFNSGSIQSLWVCLRDGADYPEGTFNSRQEAVDFMVDHHCKKIKNKKPIAEMLAALRAVDEAFSYVGPSALPSDAAVDWESVAEQVDLAIYHAVNIGVQKEATQ
jgi:hypothetical protein